MLSASRVFQARVQEDAKIVETIQRASYVANDHENTTEILQLQDQLKLAQQKQLALLQTGTNETLEKFTQGNAEVLRLEQQLQFKKTQRDTLLQAGMAALAKQSSLTPEEKSNLNRYMQEALAKVPENPPFVSSQSQAITMLLQQKKPSTDLQSAVVKYQSIIDTNPFLIPDFKTCASSLLKFIGDKINADIPDIPMDLSVHATMKQDSVVWKYIVAFQARPRAENLETLARDAQAFLTSALLTLQQQWKQDDFQKWALPVSEPSNVTTWHEQLCWLLWAKCARRVALYLKHQAEVRSVIVHMLVLQQSLALADNKEQIPNQIQTLRTEIQSINAMIPEVRVEQHVTFNGMWMTLLSQLNAWQHQQLLNNIDTVRDTLDIVSNVISILRQLGGKECLDDARNYLTTYLACIGSSGCSLSPLEQTCSANPLTRDLKEVQEQFKAVIASLERVCNQNTTLCEVQQEQYKQQLLEARVLEHALPFLRRHQIDTWNQRQTPITVLPQQTRTQTIAQQPNVNPPRLVPVSQPAPTQGQPQQPQGQPQQPQGQPQQPQGQPQQPQGQPQQPQSQPLQPQGQQAGNEADEENKQQKRWTKLQEQKNPMNMLECTSKLEQFGNAYAHAVPMLHMQKNMQLYSDCLSGTSTLSMLTSSLLTPEANHALQEFSPNKQETDALNDKLADIQVLGIEIFPEVTSIKTAWGDTPLDLNTIKTEIDNLERKLDKIDMGLKTMEKDAEKLSIGMVDKMLASLQSETKETCDVKQHLGKTTLSWESIPYSAMSEAETTCAACGDEPCQQAAFTKMQEKAWDVAMLQSRPEYSAAKQKLDAEEQKAQTKRTQAKTLLTTMENEKKALHAKLEPLRNTNPVPVIHIFEQWFQGSRGFKANEESIQTLLTEAKQIEKDAHEAFDKAVSFSKEELETEFKYAAPYERVVDKCDQHFSFAPETPFELANYEHSLCQEKKCDAPDVTDVAKCIDDAKIVDEVKKIRESLSRELEDPRVTVVADGWSDLRAKYIASDQKLSQLRGDLATLYTDMEKEPANAYLQVGKARELLANITEEQKNFKILKQEWDAKQIEFKNAYHNAYAFEIIPEQVEIPVVDWNSECASHDTVVALATHTTKDWFKAVEECKTKLDVTCTDAATRAICANPIAEEMLRKNTRGFGRDEAKTLATEIQKNLKLHQEAHNEYKQAWNAWKAMLGAVPILRDMVDLRVHQVRFWKATMSLATIRAELVHQQTLLDIEVLRLREKVAGATSDQHKCTEEVLFVQNPQQFFWNSESRKLLLAECSKCATNCSLDFEALKAAHSLWVGIDAKRAVLAQVWKDYLQAFSYSPDEINDVEAKINALVQYSTAKLDEVKKGVDERKKDVLQMVLDWQKENETKRAELQTAVEDLEQKAQTKSQELDNMLKVNASFRVNAALDAYTKAMEKHDYTFAGPVPDFVADVFPSFVDNILPSSQITLERYLNHLQSCFEKFPVDANHDHLAMTACLEGQATPEVVELIYARKQTLDANSQDKLAKVIQYQNDIQAKLQMFATSQGEAVRVVERLCKLVREKPALDSFGQSLLRTLSNEEQEFLKKPETLDHYAMIQKSLGELAKSCVDFAEASVAIMYKSEYAGCADIFDVPNLAKKCQETKCNTPESCTKIEEWMESITRAYKSDLADTPLEDDKKLLEQSVLQRVDLMLDLRTLTLAPTIDEKTDLGKVFEAIKPWQDKVTADLVKNFESKFPLESDEFKRLHANEQSRRKALIERLKMLQDLIDDLKWHKDLQVRVNSRGTKQPMSLKVELDEEKTCLQELKTHLNMAVQLLRDFVNFSLVTPPTYTAANKKCKINDALTMTMDKDEWKEFVGTMKKDFDEAKVKLFGRKDLKGKVVEEGFLDKLKPKVVAIQNQYSPSLWTEDFAVLESSYIDELKQKMEKENRSIGLIQLNTTIITPPPKNIEGLWNFAIQLQTILQFLNKIRAVNATYAPLPDKKTTCQALHKTWLNLPQNAGNSNSIVNDMKAFLRSLVESKSPAPIRNFYDPNPFYSDPPPWQEKCGIGAVITTTS